jgi:hypothetical protein
MFSDQLRAAIDAARTSTNLDDLSRAIWVGHSESVLGDDDAQELAERIQARRMALAGPPEGRKTVFTASGRPTIFRQRRPQRSPDRAASRERRRRLSLTGPLPPGLRELFTESERAVLKVIADEVRKHGVCDRSIGEIAARAGVCRTTAQNTVRLAAREFLIHVQERRRPGQRNLTNVIAIISKEWRTWLQRGPRSVGEEGGFKKPDPTDEILSTGRNRSAQENRLKGYQKVGAASGPPRRA